MMIDILRPFSLFSDRCSTPFSRCIVGLSVIGLVFSSSSALLCCCVGLPWCRPCK